MLIGEIFATWFGHKEEFLVHQRETEQETASWSLLQSVAETGKVDDEDKAQREPGLDEKMKWKFEEESTCISKSGWLEQWVWYLYYTNEVPVLGKRKSLLLAS